MSITLQQLPAALAREEKRIQEAIQGAMNATAKRAVRIVQENAPKAFGPLRESVSAKFNDGIARTVVSAPYASAVEIGSLPHTPNFERLLAWVKLRGMQGLTRSGNTRWRYSRSEGPTTPHQATRVTALIHEAETGSRGAKGGAQLPAKAAEVAARRISRSIELHGTSPQFFVQKSLPAIEKILEIEVRRRVFSRERSRVFAALRTQEKARMDNLLLQDEQ